MKKTTHTLPVSQKFISRIEQRIADILSAIGAHSPEIHALTMSYIHAYLEQRSLPTPVDAIGRQCHLIVLTLRAEIDAAITRSQRARQRRHKQEASSTVNTSTAEIVKPAATDEVKTSPSVKTNHNRHRNPSYTPPGRFGLKILNDQAKRGRRH